MGNLEHKKNALKKLTIGIITVSTTRTLEDDKSGSWMKKMAEKEGHDVLVHQVVSDDQIKIAHAVLQVISEVGPNILITTGGTGLNPTDVTIEAVRPMFTKEINAFGTIFTMLSYEEIDSAAMLSRATAGIINKTTIFCLPGSLNACKLACKEIIFPEAGHVAAHVNMEQ